MKGRWIAVRRAELRKRLARKAAKIVVGTVTSIMIFEAVILLLFWKKPEDVDRILIWHHSFCGVVDYREMMIDVGNRLYYEYNMPGYWLERDTQAENQGYQIVRRLDQKDMDRFFAAASRHGFWSWRGRFENRDIIDGGSWEIVVSYKNGSNYSVSGYADGPAGWRKGSEEYRRVKGEWV